jgi:hypothetical protein
MTRLLTTSIAVALLGAAAIPATASSGRYVTDCNRAKMRPSSITITCGDANAAVIDLKWSSWGGSKAHATGKFAYNDCKPSCAGGSGKTVPATVALSGSKMCGSRNTYHAMVVHFTGKLPSGYKRYTPIVLGCPY